MFPLPGRQSEPIDLSADKGYTAGRVQIPGQGRFVMKQHACLTIILFLLGLPTGVIAEPPPNRGPESMTFHGILSRPFPHRVHQSMGKGDCRPCHDYNSDPGKIEGWDKEMAHETCIPCHEENKLGPVRCLECHTR